MNLFSMGVTTMYIIEAIIFDCKLWVEAGSSYPDKTVQ